MTRITCAGCNRHYTHAGYSRHLSMTTRAVCRAVYDGHLDRTAVYDPLLGVSGPEDGNPGKCICWLDHASRLTIHFS
jgi:hypothetical protein